ncbi:lipoprotein-releasing ABC transporter permease subunit LolE [Colwellia sp. MSW7]|uniref:Lipoprotein-releasing ABC transporter permease subunit LolE n=1 Tax=Colwellia maritima TaxID=2912588 RepID=A0ABS9X038_9GAMM|nr:lipoprotein-releasing ABC transporter permease subunit LolE [Colwellia maritima]MCI2283561.1 lipoprotein-releasing ABC transporter permease subunit LolE [Colwellia maritima]
MVTHSSKATQSSVFKPLSIFLALRYVRSRHGQGFSTFISASSTIGIALGTMVLIVALSTMNGFERELASKLLSIVPHAELISVDKPIPNWPENVKQVASNPDVIAAAPVIILTGMMQHKTQLKGVEIRGVNANLETSVSDIEKYIVAGSRHGINHQKNNQDLASQGVDNGIVIGAGVAKTLSIGVGDKVHLLLASTKSADTSGDNAQQNVFSSPLNRQVEVVGIFKFGGTVDDTLAYISLAQAAEIKGYKANEAQGIRLKLANVFAAPSIASNIAYRFNHYVYIMDWTRTQGHLFNDIQMVRMVMFIVLVLVIAVASFNIVSTLIMAVNDKKGDIAILKTMGASNKLIMLTFIYQGLVNGVLGSLVGSVCGVLLALNLADIVAFVEHLFALKVLSADVYFIDHIPSELSMPDVYITVITAIVMSFLATIYPAWRATKIEPAQVLGQL